MAKKYIMLPEQREAIDNKLSEIFDYATAKSLDDTFNMLCKHGIPNGVFQDYWLLSLLIELHGKIIDIKKEMEARYNG